MYMKQGIFCLKYFQNYLLKIEGYTNEKNNIYIDINVNYILLIVVNKHSTILTFTKYVRKTLLLLFMFINFMKCR